MSELTGKIQKVDRCPFGRGGQGDIFTGIWAQDDDSNVVVSLTFAGPQTKFSQFIWYCHNRLLSRRFGRLHSIRNARKMLMPVLPKGLSFPISLASTTANTYRCQAKDKLVREGTIWTSLKHPDSDRLPLVSQLWFPGVSPSHISSAIQVRQVAAGVSYLHDHKVPIIHGDIKSVGPVPSPTFFLLLIQFRATF
jgi:serine/threonine protein kinase